MIRFVKTLIVVLYWLQTVAAILILAALPCFALLTYKLISVKMAIALLVAALFAWIVLAEYIRRKIGLENFYSKLFS